MGRSCPLGAYPGAIPAGPVLMAAGVPGGGCACTGPGSACAGRSSRVRPGRCPKVRPWCDLPRRGRMAIPYVGEYVMAVFPGASGADGLLFFLRSFLPIARTKKRLIFFGIPDRRRLTPSRRSEYLERLVRFRAPSAQRFTAL